MCLLTSKPTAVRRSPPPSDNYATCDPEHGEGNVVQSTPPQAVPIGRSSQSQHGRLCDKTCLKGDLLSTVSIIHVIVLILLRRIVLIYPLHLCRRTTEDKKLYLEYEYLDDRFT